MGFRNKLSDEVVGGGTKTAFKTHLGRYVDRNGSEGSVPNVDKMELAEIVLPGGHG